MIIILLITVWQDTTVYLVFRLICSYEPYGNVVMVKEFVFLLPKIISSLGRPPIILVTTYGILSQRMLSCPRPWEVVDATKYKRATVNWVVTCMPVVTKVATRAVTTNRIWRMGRFQSLVFVCGWTKMRSFSKACILLTVHKNRHLSSLHYCCVCELVLFALLRHHYSAV